MELNRDQLTSIFEESASETIEILTHIKETNELYTDGLFTVGTFIQLTLERALRRAIPEELFNKDLFNLDLADVFELGAYIDILATTMVSREDDEQTED